MRAATRRRFLARGGMLAAGVALPGALLARPALAQEGAESDALEGLIELEQAAELAYSLAAEELDGAAAELARTLGGYAGEHATALSEALDQLGGEAPAPSDDPATYDALAEFDRRAAAGAQLRFLAGLEEELVAAYERATGDLDAAELVVTGARIGAAHAQALVALRLEAGLPAAALARLPDTAPADSGG